jgi:von Willebrand factor type A domain
MAPPALFLLAAALFAGQLAVAQTLVGTFQANVQIQGKVGVLGVINATMNYDFTTERRRIGVFFPTPHPHARLVFSPLSIFPSKRLRFLGLGASFGLQLRQRNQRLPEPTEVCVFVLVSCFRVCVVGHLLRISFVSFAPCYRADTHTHTRKTRFVFCDACESETFNRAMPIYFPAETLAGTGAWTPVAGQDITAFDGRTCSRLDRLPANHGRGKVFQIWVDSSGSPCRTVADNELAGGTSDAGGETIDYWNVQATASQALLTEDSSWSCPRPVCAIKIDLVLIFDESSSIGSGDFNTMKAFMRDVVAGYSVSPVGAHVRVKRLWLFFSF